MNINICTGSKNIGVVQLKKLIEEKSRSILPSSMIPKVVVLESDYPRLVNGKVDRQTLVRTFESKLNEVKAHVIVRLIRSKINAN